LNKDLHYQPEEGFTFTKRNLPHWEFPGSIYFITFSTANGYELNEIAKDIAFNTIKFHADKKYSLFACVVMSTHVHMVL